MAAPKVEKKALNEPSFDLMWKMHVTAEEKAPKVWNDHWGWIVDEYRRLKVQLDEKVGSSKYLRTANKKHIEIKDPRRPPPVPPTYNGWYGWLAKDEQFSLNKYGDDFFHPMPLPPLYRLIK
ncbi:unnamed protein product [Callosobruchus maculatus]|uniref:Uncharacterized protein n=1 Tax=Callosobruchus maculatus TaxID=64391 RepID=A0A653BVJ4_CALMS|nr:unnamed protein product [Callosobruchus maculatus]